MNSSCDACAVVMANYAVDKIFQQLLSFLLLLYIHL